MQLDTKQRKLSDQQPQINLIASITSYLLHLCQLYFVNHSFIMFYQSQFQYSLTFFILFIMNLLVKDLADLRQNKKQRDIKYQGNLNLEDLLYRIQLHSVKTNIERVKITEQQFVQLCRRVKKQLLSQPGLLKIDGPIYVCTGTLGNYHELSNIIDKCGHPKFMNYLFLGDYAGRYDQSVECIVALFAYKLFMPNNFFMLRGCHQTIALAKSYQLQEHLMEFFSSSTPWLQVCQAFCALPYAAVIDQKALCIHGGLSPYLQTIQQINTIPRPMDASDKQLSCDLLWSDPTNLYQGWTMNDRGISVSFGADVVATFLKTNDLTIICRGHQIAYDGFRFFADKKMVTICSLAQYCNIANNSSAVMMIDEQSNVLFKMISDRNQYSGRDKEEGLNFMEMIQRKKQKQERKMAEELEIQRKTKSNKGTKERKTKGKKQ